MYCCAFYREHSTGHLKALTIGMFPRDRLLSDKGKLRCNESPFVGHTIVICLVAKQLVSWNISALQNPKIAIKKSFQRKLFLGKIICIILCNYIYILNQIFANFHYIWLCVCCLLILLLDFSKTPVHIFRAYVIFLGISSQKTPKKGLKILFDQKNFKNFPGRSRQTSKNAIKNFFVHPPPLENFLGRSSPTQDEWKKI